MRDAGNTITANLLGSDLTGTGADLKNCTNSGNYRRDECLSYGLNRKEEGMSNGISFAELAALG